MSVNLILGDCLEEMNKMTAGSVDMILTDPPYEISNSGGWYDGQGWS